MPVELVLLQISLSFVVQIKGESLREAVITSLLSYQDRKYIFLVAEIVLIGSPDLHMFFWINQFFFLLRIDSWVEHGVVAHIFC